MRKSVVVLGSTGSIGKATLEICKEHDIEIEALVANSSVELLQKQIDEFKPRFVAIADPKYLEKIEHPHIFSGKDGILELIDNSKSKTVVNALVGYAGLNPTIRAIEQKKRVALANKESLVVAGAFINKSQIVPIDSEHFGLKYLLDCSQKSVDRLVITASGGAFRDWERDKVVDAKYEDALLHPNWSMGEKITIDSATMVNKLFELLEAKWLFGVEKIDAVIERSSTIHALVEFVDGSTTAHFAKADMKLPIAYSILDEIKEPIIERVNLLEVGSFGFEKIDEKKYPLWSLKDDLLKNPKMGVVLNAANEEAIEKFKSQKCNFGKMCDSILETYKRFENSVPESINDINSIDKEVREFIKYKIRGIV